MHTIMERAADNAIWLLELLRHSRGCDSNDSYTALLVALRVLEDVASREPAHDGRTPTQLFKLLKNYVENMPVVGVPDASQPGRAVVIRRSAGKA